MNQLWTLQLTILRLNSVKRLNNPKSAIVAKKGSKLRWIIIFSVVSSAEDLLLSAPVHAYCNFPHRHRYEHILHDNLPALHIMHNKRVTKEANKVTVSDFLFWIGSFFVTGSTWYILIAIIFCPSTQSSSFLLTTTITASYHSLLFLTTINHRPTRIVNYCQTHSLWHLSKSCLWTRAAKCPGCCCPGSGGSWVKDKWTPVKCKVTACD